jgi:hypothetical protein
VAVYLLGRYRFNKFTRIGWATAIHYYEQALQVDPTYALAYCGLSDTSAGAEDTPCQVPLALVYAKSPAR